jgi:hypothetical protein
MNSAIGPMLMRGRNSKSPAVFRKAKYTALKLLTLIARIQLDFMVSHDFTMGSCGGIC